VCLARVRYGSRSCMKVWTEYSTEVRSTVQYSTVLVRDCSSTRIRMKEGGPRETTAHPWPFPFTPPGDH
jgi:hypothetical protein